MAGRTTGAADGVAAAGTVADAVAAAGTVVAGTVAVAEAAVDPVVEIASQT